MEKKPSDGPGRIFQPFTIGETFRIVPPGNDDPVEAGLVRIRMAPGAFGSGEHETTAGCLDLLSGLPCAGASVLDLGSGTGILAIAAIQLGAHRALCIDNDPDAAASCLQNARLNGMTGMITCHLGTLADAPPGRFDLVLANIYGDILLAEAESLVSRARSGTPLILSGILHEQAFDVRKRFERMGCGTLTTLMLGEFCAILLERH